MDIPDPSTEAIGAAAGALLLLGGIFVLRHHWLRRRAWGRIGVFCGWLLIAAALVVFGFAWGGELGTVYGLLAFSAVAYVLIALGVELREAKQRGQRDIALEPEERPTNWTRRIAKSFLAIVLAGIAAIGIGVAFAVAMPLDAKDRILIGGLLVPVLWGAGMAWTLSDAKLVRATLMLTVISIVAYAIAFLPKMMES